MPTMVLRRALTTVQRAALRATCALPLALAACEPAPTAIELADRSVVLHGVIVAGAEHATIVLTEMIDGPTGVHAVPLSGARVQLIAGGDTTRLEQGKAAVPCAVSPWIPEEAFLDACYSATVPGGIREGTRYDLHVALPDGGVIRGSTVVPRAATLLHPAPGSEITVQRHNAPGAPASIDISWDHDAQPDLAELRISAGVTDCAVLLQGPGALLFAEDVTSRRDAAVQPRLSCLESAWVDRLPADVVLTVFDPNYATYVWHAKTSGAALHPEAASGITGAFGVFGSAAADRVPVSLIVQQGSSPAPAQ